VQISTPGRPLDADAGVDVDVDNEEEDEDAAAGPAGAALGIEVAQQRGAGRCSERERSEEQGGGMLRSHGEPEQGWMSDITVPGGPVDFEAVWVVLSARGRDLAGASRRLGSPSRASMAIASGSRRPRRAPRAALALLALGALPRVGVPRRGPISRTTRRRIARLWEQRGAAVERLQPIFLERGRARTVDLERAARADGRGRAPLADGSPGCLTVAVLAVRTADFLAGLEEPPGPRLARLPALPLAPSLLAPPGASGRPSHPRRGGRGHPVALRGRAGRAPPH